MSARLSIVIPCYERIPHLEETLASVAKTNLSGLEVLLVDDGSSNPLLPHFEKLQTKFSGLTFKFLVQTNGGPAKGRNTGVRHASAPIVLPLDSDDELISENVEEFLLGIETSVEQDIVYGDFQCFGHRDEYCRGLPWEKFLHTKYNGLAYCSLYRKALWEKLGGYNEVIPYGVEDWQFWIHAKDQGARGHYIPKPILRYRVHSGTLTSGVSLNDILMKAEVIRSLPGVFSWTQERWAQLVKQHKGLLAEVELHRGSWSHRVGVMPSDSLAALDCALLSMLAGDVKVANEYFVQAFSLDENPRVLIEQDETITKLVSRLADVEVAQADVSFLRRIKRKVLS